MEGSPMPMPPQNGCCVSTEKAAVNKNELYYRMYDAEQIALDVKKELIRARNGHGPMRSKHEGYAVLLEEVEEVQQEVFHGKDNGKLRAELIQVAAMAQRMIEDLSL
jgi:hypothetical protein